MALGLLQKFGVAGFKSEDDLGYLLIGTLCFQGATCILMPLFFRFHNVSLGEGLGFTQKRWPRTLLLAFGVMIVVWPLASGLAALSIDLMEKLHWKVEDELAVKLVLNASSRAAAIYLGFFCRRAGAGGGRVYFSRCTFPVYQTIGLS